MISSGLNKLRLDPHRTVFLAGSGISIPSGLPSGMAFNSHLAAWLTCGGSELQAIRKLLVLKDSDRAVPRIRFEQLVALLRDTIDPDVRLLEVFDAQVPPSFIHYWLASALDNGATVFTSNFDSLIERAYYSLPTRRAQRGLAVAFVNAGRGKSYQYSFRRQVHTRRQPVLFKLHGTLSLVQSSAILGDHDSPFIKTVGATLDTIGLRTDSAGLEMWKHRALERAVAGKTLVVLGYSGLDDFDIVPALAAVAPRVKQVVWISHSARKSQVLQGRTTHVPALLADVLYKRGMSATVIEGSTADIVAQLIKPAFAYPAISAPPVKLLDYLPVTDTATKTYLVGRLFHIAASYKQALRAYQRCLAKVGRKGAERATLLEWASDAHFELGRTAKALSLNRKSIALEPNQSPAKASRLVDRARMLTRAGDEAGALALCQRVRRNWSRSMSSSVVVAAMMREVDLLHRRGKRRQALTIALSATKLCARIRDRIGQARCQMYRSRLYRDSGDSAAAVKCSQTAQRLYGMQG